MIDEEQYNRTMKLNKDLAWCVTEVKNRNEALMSENLLHKVTISRKDDLIALLEKRERLNGYMQAAALIAGMILEYLFITNYGK